MNPDAISRRGFLAASALAGAQTARPPNLILFMPETLRADSLACYGHPLVETPHIDRLAGQGVRFEQAHGAEYRVRPFALLAHDRLAGARDMDNDFAV